MNSSGNPTVALHYSYMLKKCSNSRPWLKDKNNCCLSITKGGMISFKRLRYDVTWSWMLVLMTSIALRPRVYLHLFMVMHLSSETDTLLRYYVTHMIDRLFERQCALFLSTVLSIFALLQHSYNERESFIIIHQCLTFTKRRGRASERKTQG